MNSDRNFYQSIGGMALATGLILLIPLVLTLLGSGVDGEGFHWTLTDFIFAGTLLFSTGFTYKLITRRSGETAYRVAVGFALFTGLFLIWVNGAVGIIGSENNEINLFYFGVIAVGVIGAFIARFQVEGMMLTMFAMGLSQALIAAIALVTGMAEAPGSSVTEIIGVNGFFIVLFVVSALLFRHATLEQPPANPEAEK